MKKRVLIIGSIILVIIGVIALMFLTGIVRIVPVENNPIESTEPIETPEPPSEPYVQDGIVYLPEDSNEPEVEIIPESTEPPKEEPIVDSFYKKPIEYRGEFDGDKVDWTVMEYSDYITTPNYRIVVFSTANISIDKKPGPSTYTFVDYDNDEIEIELKVIESDEDSLKSDKFRYYGLFDMYEWSKDNSLGFEQAYSIGEGLIDYGSLGMEKDLTISSFGAQVIGDGAISSAVGVFTVSKFIYDGIKTTYAWKEVEPGYCLQVKVESPKNMTHDAYVEDILNMGFNFVKMN